MVKKRLIPKLLVQTRPIGGREHPVLVTTRGFDKPRLVGDPVSQAKIYEAQMADELIVLNITRAPLGNGSPIIGLIRALAGQTFMPLTVGGGVGSLADFDILLQNGADKVAVTSAAVEAPDLIEAAARTFGAQCVVVGIDVVRGEDGTLQVATDRARRVHDIGPVAFAVEAVRRGAGELLLTDVGRDGSTEGLNVELCRAITETVDVPVILSGGAGLASHFTEGFIQGGAEGVAAGTFFAFRDQNPMQTRSHIANAGIRIRMLT